MGDDTTPNQRTTKRRPFLKAVCGGSTLSIAGLAGCIGGQSGGGTGKNGNSSEKAGKSGQITLEYVDVAGARSKELFQPALDELNNEYDATVKLDFTEIPYENMQKQLLTRIGGGNAPDIAAIDQIWLGPFIDSGKLMTFDDIKADVGFNDYLDAFADVATQSGHLYGFPITTDVRGMYWNKKLFEGAGLDPETPPKTWSELYDMAAKVHNPPKTYGLTYLVVGGRWTVNLFAAGGQVLSDDGTKPLFQKNPGVKAAEFVDTIYNEEKIAPPNPVYQNGSQMAREFLKGQYAINVVEGSWLDYFWRNLGHENEPIVDQFGFAPTPAPKGGTRTTMSGGFIWSAFKDSKHPDVVKDFLRIAAGKEFKKRVAVKTGSVPTRKSLLDAAEIWDQIQYADTIKEMVQNTNTRPIQNWSVVAEALDSALQRVAFDKAEPNSALQKAASQVRNDLG